MWMAPFLERAFAVPRGEIGIILGPIVGIMGGSGALLGGYLADRLGRRDLRWKGWVVGIAKFVAVPISIVALLSHDLAFALAFYLPAAVLGAFYHGPGNAIVQSVTPLAMRATVSGILLFILNLIGLGFGPLAVGAVSDLLTPMFGNDSLRYALMSTALLNVWAGVHYMLAGTAFAREIKELEGQRN